MPLVQTLVCVHTHTKRKRTNNFQIIKTVQKQRSNKYKFFRMGEISLFMYIISLSTGIPNCTFSWRTWLSVLHFLPHHQFLPLYNTQMQHIFFGKLISSILKSRHSWALAPCRPISLLSLQKIPLKMSTYSLFLLFILTLLQGKQSMYERHEAGMKEFNGWV